MTMLEIWEALSTCQLPRQIAFSESSSAERGEDQEARPGIYPRLIFSIMY